MTIERRITLGFVAGLVILAAVSVTSYVVIGDSRRAAELRRWSAAVLAQLDDVLVRMDDAESGARGFVLTGEEQYLQPYREAVQEIDRELNEITDLLMSDPAQLEQVNALRSLVRARLAPGSVGGRDVQKISSQVAVLRGDSRPTVQSAGPGLY